VTFRYAATVPSVGARLTPQCLDMADPATFSVVYLRRGLVLPIEDPAEAISRPHPLADAYLAPEGTYGWYYVWNRLDNGRRVRSVEYIIGDETKLETAALLRSQRSTEAKAKLAVLRRNDADAIVNCRDGYSRSFYRALQILVNPV
jgi:hypothetical protein